MILPLLVLTKNEPMIEAMEAASEVVQSLEVTIATRSVEIDGVEVREGQVIGLLDGKLVAAGQDLSDTFVELLNHARIDRAELLTIYHGADMSADAAQAVVERVRSAHPQVEVELVDGGQPHYQLIASLE